MTIASIAAAKADLAPAGELLVGLNHANFLLVGTDPTNGDPLRCGAGSGA